MTVHVAQHAESAALAAHEMATANVTIQPADANDTAAMVEVHTAAFKSDHFSNLMLLGREDGAHQDMMARSVDVWLKDPAAELIKAVDENGNLVGWSCWVRKDAMPAPSSTTTAAPADDKTPRALGRRMHGEMVAWEHRCTGGKPYVTLQAMAVHPDHQGRGIGRKLVEYVTQKADELGLSSWAHASEASARLYERSGFQVMGKSEYNLQDYGGESTYTFRYMFRPALDKPT